MKIVPVTSELIPALSRLASETFTETFGHLYPPEDLDAFLHASYAPDILSADVSDPAQFWRIALDETGTAAGYVHCVPVELPHPDTRPGQEGELKRLYIHSSQQGKGLGKTLLGVAIQHMSERYGDAPQWLGVWCDNHKAQALYASLGFEHVGQYKFPVGATLDDEFVFRRNPHAAP